ncbi:hypothetical protein BHE74_00013145 [Ensete ventricosum]|nr:hypothetical protein GW17_00015397 [Ensete ventricosum]RWW78632.1 hypothetical protein BHE74_00013145 [Ensete ventricosum]RZR76733.1 hypothetical protein BHM03_00001613 [Ensete ventricosum]
MKGKLDHSCRSVEDVEYIHCKKWRGEATNHLLTLLIHLKSSFLPRSLQEESVGSLFLLFRPSVSGVAFSVFTRKTVLFRPSTSQAGGSLKQGSPPQAASSYSQ